jgi:hypothetical protein
MLLGGLFRILGIQSRMILGVPCRIHSPPIEAVQE